MKRIACAALAVGLSVLSTQVEARRANSTLISPFGFDGRWTTTSTKYERHAAVRHGNSLRGKTWHRKHLRGYTKIARRNHSRTGIRTSDARVVGGRPAGCPHAYCGCEAARYLGIQNTNGYLNLAWNWAMKFRRTHAFVGAAAVRPHHVAVIIGGEPGRWLVHDGNSGGGLTREHYRALHGYVFVDPSSRVASR